MKRLAQEMYKWAILKYQLINNNKKKQQVGTQRNLLTFDIMF